MLRNGSLISMSKEPSEPFTNWRARTRPVATMREGEEEEDSEHHITASYQSVVMVSSAVKTVAVFLAWGGIVRKESKGSRRCWKPSSAAGTVRSRE